MINTLLLTAGFKIVFLSQAHCSVTEDLTDRGPGIANTNIRLFH